MTGGHNIQNFTELTGVKLDMSHKYIIQPFITYVKLKSYDNSTIDFDLNLTIMNESF